MQYCTYNLKNQCCNTKTTSPPSMAAATAAANNYIYIKKQILVSTILCTKNCTHDPHIFREMMT